MKLNIFVLTFLASFASHADPACTALSSFIGTYKIVSQTCQGPFGKCLKVEAFTTSNDAGYMLTSGNIGIGPSISANAVDKCVVDHGTVTVITGVLSQNSIPRGWTYSFNGSSATFSANGCSANFTK